MRTQEHSAACDWCGDVMRASSHGELAKLTEQWCTVEVMTNDEAIFVQDEVCENCTNEARAVLKMTKLQAQDRKRLLYLVAHCENCSRKLNELTMRGGQRFVLREELLALVKTCPSCTASEEFTRRERAAEQSLATFELEAMGALKGGG